MAGLEVGMAGRLGTRRGTGFLRDPNMIRRVYPVLVLARDLFQLTLGQFELRCGLFQLRDHFLPVSFHVSTKLVLICVRITFYCGQLSSGEQERVLQHLVVH